jgi:5-methylcytosine-specific restriction endonuclease McrA
VPSEEVDHVNGDAWDMSPENLAATCKACHSRKTVAQDGGLGRERKTSGGAG